MGSSALVRLDGLLEKTNAAYQLMLKRGAGQSQLAPFRQNLGLIHLKIAEIRLSAGNVDQAIANARQAHGFLPGNADAVGLLARALVAVRHPDEAVTTLQAALERGIVDAPLSLMLAQLLAGMGRTQEAIAHFETAASLMPGDLAVIVALANALAQTGALADSLVQWRKALAIDPDAVDHLQRFAVLANDAGALEDAAAAYRRLTELRPLAGVNHRMLGQQITYQAGHPHIAEMQAALAANAPLGQDACELHFGLFRAFEGAEDYARAFGHLKAANDILRSQNNYRPEIYQRLFAGVEAAFSAEAIQTLPKVDREEAPIFIVGMPRSGSTLVEQILSSHPDVTGVGETSAFAEITETHFLTPALTLDLRPLFDRAVARRLGDGYLAAVTAQSGDGRRTVDKYLTNFLSIGLIRTLLPKARIIHCHRNPLANCFAIYASYFATSGIPFHADMQQTAEYYSLYHRLMQHWRDVYGAAILDLSYEALTQDQEGETRRLLSHCGLAWDPACLEFHKNERSVRTLSYNQVRKPLYSGIDRRTAHYLGEIAPMARVLATAGLA